MSETSISGLRRNLSYSDRWRTSLKRADITYALDPQAKRLRIPPPAIHTRVPPVPAVHTRLGTSRQPAVHGGAALGGKHGRSLESHGHRGHAVNEAERTQPCCRRARAAPWRGCSEGVLSRAVCWRCCVSKMNAKSRRRCQPGGGLGRPTLRCGTEPARPGRFRPRRGRTPA